MLTQDPALHSFISHAVKTPEYKLLPLAGDASNRRYYRVIVEETSLVLMRWEPFDPNNYPFLSVLNHFARNGINVPQVISMSAGEGLVLLEDLGDLTLERKYWESPNSEISRFFYKMAIDEIVKIHFPATADKSDCTAFKIKFDTDKFMWEMNYAREHLLMGVLKFSFTDELEKELQKLFLSICQKLDAEPKRIAHRDFHSRNLMIKLDKMNVIDFQDARLGPIQYDLVSLLRDSYVDMPETMESELLNYYLESIQSYDQTRISRTHFDEIYELQTVQRCFKACGSFASFYNARQDRRYLKYLSKTLRTVMKSLSRFQEYKLLTDILIDSGALEKKYESL